jgi:hypothetical protein
MCKLLILFAKDMKIDFFFGFIQDTSILCTSIKFFGSITNFFAYKAVNVRIVIVSKFCLFSSAILCSYERGDVCICACSPLQRFITTLAHGERTDALHTSTKVLK